MRGYRIRSEFGGSRLRKGRLRPTTANYKAQSTVLSNGHRGLVDAVCNVLTSANTVRATPVISATHH
jgi:hypothetical protein